MTTCPERVPGMEDGNLGANERTQPDLNKVATSTRKRRLANLLANEQAVKPLVKYLNITEVGVKKKRRRKWQSGIKRHIRRGRTASLQRTHILRYTASKVDRPKAEPRRRSKGRRDCAEKERRGSKDWTEPKK